MESQDTANTDAVNCSGSLSLDLPPGLAVVGGRRTLSADVDYTVQPAADGSGNVVLLRNADAIVTPLATLARLERARARQRATPPAELNQVTPTMRQARRRRAKLRRLRSRSSPGLRQRAQPSFDCADARTKGEIAVCSDSGLAALDRNMAAQYRPSDGARLARPARRCCGERRDRFLAYRDRCPNRSCIGDAYVGRMREIRDIMEGNWQPPR